MELRKWDCRSNSPHGFTRSTSREGAGNQDGKGFQLKTRPKFDRPIGRRSNGSIATNSTASGHHRPDTMATHMHSPDCQSATSTATPPLPTVFCWHCVDRLCACAPVLLAASPPSATTDRFRSKSFATLPVLASTRPNTVDGRPFPLRLLRSRPVVSLPPLPPLHHLHHLLPNCVGVLVGGLVRLWPLVFSALFSTPIFDLLARHRCGRPSRLFRLSALVHDLHSHNGVGEVVGNCATIDSMLDYCCRRHREKEVPGNRLVR